MFSKTARSITYGLLVGTSLAAFALPASAQALQTPPSPAAEATPPPAADASTTSNDAAATADIIVTAQFRSERLQDAPLAISAISGATLANRGQTNVADLGGYTPNLTIKRTGDAFGPAAAIFIRGIGQSDSNFALEPGVGVYIDDVYYSTVFGTTFDLVDLDRVEVLRGPQGTLAGKNSIGGALKLYSKTPGNDLSGFGQVTAGSFDRVDLTGSINIPLVQDRLALRLSGVRNDSNGYVTRYDYGCLNPTSGVPAVGTRSDCKLGTSGGRKTWGLRGTLGWNPSDAIKLTLIGDYSEDHSPPAASVATYIDGRGRRFLNGTPFDSRFVTAGTYTSYAGYTDPGGTYPGRNPVTGQSTVTVTQPNQFVIDPDTNLRDWGVSGRLEIALAPSLSLTSVTGYRAFDGTFSTDADASPFNYQLAQQRQRHTQISQELRLSGSSLNRFLDWTVGGFFFDEKNRAGGRTQIPSVIDTGLDDRIAARSYSAFAHATAHLTDALDLTGGLRYSHDTKRYEFDRSSPQQAGIDGKVATYKGGRLDYKLNLSYKVTDDILTYGQFSTGYRAGGTNPRPFSANQVAAFDPESLNAYEVGLKTSLLDKALTLNLAGFYNRYKNILVVSAAAFTNPNQPIDENPASPGYNPSAGTFPAYVVLNGGRAEIKGFEAEAFIRPDRATRVELSFSYLDSRYTELSRAAVSAGLTLGSALTYSPKFKWSGGAEHAFDIGRFGALTPRVDITFQSDFYSTATPLAYGNVDAYSVTNLRITWASPDKSWQVSGAVSNVFDTYYYINKQDLVAQSGVASAQPGRPREWTLSLRRTF